MNLWRRWGLIGSTVACLATSFARADAGQDAESLFRDLMIVRAIDAKLHDHMPAMYDFYGTGGYFVMPSARLPCEGVFMGGFSYVPPYRVYNVGVAITDHFEAALNYRVFGGIEDPILSCSGFGDFSDKGANLKWALFTPEDSDYCLPGVALGWDDFLGTRNFEARYAVATYVFPAYNVEVTGGLGEERLHGLFGGVLWMPFRQTPFSYLKHLALTAEVDATSYNTDPHPCGRQQHSLINYGFKWRLWQHVDLSLARIRGEEIAASAQVHYNFGDTKGFLPKVDDPLPYRSPANTQPIGLVRSAQGAVNEILYAFCDQGFILLDAWTGLHPCLGKILRFKVYNTKYASECEQRKRLSCLVANLTPIDVDEVIVVIESEGFPAQEYRFPRQHLERWRTCCIGDFELAVLAPLGEVSWPNPCLERRLFHQSRRLYNLYVRPDFSSQFGSARGKFKYALGVVFGSEGFLYDDIYYSAEVGLRLVTDMENVGDMDRLNPSQIINVHSDNVRYNQSGPLRLNEFYLQKNWNMGGGVFSRVTGGYFARNYGGLATELLYYPVDAPWAIGFEAAWLNKRQYSGLGFTNKIRKLDGFQATYQDFFGWHAFLDVYYDSREAQVDLQATFGRFLAGDTGARIEVGRYFSSGIRIFAWYSRTNAHDYINGERYFDKGIGFSAPLDLFYTYCTRKRWEYSMSAWLRDISYRVDTGQSLYTLINELRQP